MALDYKDSEGFRLYQQIPPVELRVGAKLPGRVERYDHAGHLLRRLDVLGREQKHILGLTEAGQPLPEQHVEALNLYLHSCKGLRSFKRVNQSGSALNKYAWSEFRAKLNIPELAVLVSV